jgi:hypothetical protein
MFLLSLFIPIPSNLLLVDDGNRYTEQFHQQPCGTVAMVGIYAGGHYCQLNLSSTRLVGSISVSSMTIISQESLPDFSGLVHKMVSGHCSYLSANESPFLEDWRRGHCTVSDYQLPFRILVPAFNHDMNVNSARMA